LNKDVYVATERERRIAAALRERAIAEIERRSDLEEVARLLNVMPVWVKALLATSEWDLELAFRVADTLEIAVAREIESVVAA
jgi:hypothetical protein